MCADDYDRVFDSNNPVILAGNLNGNHTAWNNTRRNEFEDTVFRHIEQRNVNALCLGVAFVSSLGLLWLWTSLLLRTYLTFLFTRLFCNQPFAALATFYFALLTTSGEVSTQPLIRPYMEFSSFNIRK